MTTHSPRLSALLASRICHDLISPIGAIGNGLELLVMSGAAGSGPEITLINDSVVQANARIRFFRIAFGVSGRDQQIGKAEILSILSDMTAGTRLTVEWHIPPSLPRDQVKLCFLMILCIETALPYGGRIRLEQTDGKWTVTAESHKLRHDPAIWDFGAAANPPDPAADLGPAKVQFLIAREEAADQGRQIDIRARQERLEISF